LLRSEALEIVRETILAPKELVQRLDSVFCGVPKRERLVKVGMYRQDRESLDSPKKRIPDGEAIMSSYSGRSFARTKA